MTKTELHMIYKQETGINVRPDWTFEIIRERGQWILNVSDEEKISWFGFQTEFDVPDLDYIEWLERKVMENEEKHNQTTTQVG